MSGICEAIQKILLARANIPATRSLLVGVSGIDGCGKGYVAAQLAARLALHGVIPAVVNVDGWLNPPEKRFDQDAPQYTSTKTLFGWINFSLSWSYP